MGFKTTVTTSLGDDPGTQLSLVVVADDVLITHALPPLGKVMIGRAAECDIRIDHTSISRNHAMLQLGGHLFVIDLGSANGTWVHDQRITPNQPVAFGADQAVRVGAVTLLVQRRARRAQTRRVRPHTYFEERVEDECARALRHEGQFTVIHAIADDAQPLQDLFAGYLQEGDVIAGYAPGELEVLLVGAGVEQASRVLGAIETAIEQRKLVARIGSARYPRDGRDPSSLAERARSRALGEIPQELVLDEIVIADERMQALHKLVARVARADISVLLQGETGVGKEVIAEAIHRQSARAQKPFLKLNCAALLDTLLESELFGHEKGAFTGAVASKPGLLEVAEGGVVFLDEVGELSAATQAKLLRVLDERKLMRVGGLSPRSIDVRIVSATNRDLEAEVERGAFRLDLLYRLNAMSIVIPPLRERAGEILPLVQRFLHSIAAKLDEPVPRLTDEAAALLQAYSWPGNVRELRNVIERAIVLAGDVIDVRHLPDKMRNPLAAKPRAHLFADKPADGDAEERQKIIEALEVCNGNQTHAAKLLGIARRTLINKLEKFSMPRPRKR